MTTATLKKVSKHRRTCKNPACKAKFSTTDSRKLFCKPECKTLKANGLRQRKSTYEIPKTNHFLIYIAKEVERAGTLHVLDPLVNNVDALMALYGVIRTRLVANVLTGPKVSKEGKRSDPFHVAHIAPAKNDFILGQLCAENLVVLPAQLNRVHGNQHANGAGVFMYRCDMRLCNSILTTDSDILERAIAYIGLDTMTDFCRKAKLAPSQRATALKQLSSIVDHEDESHAPFIALLKDPKATTPQLAAAIETIQCKAQFKPLMKGEKLSATAMLVSELVRHADHRPELEDYAVICRPFTTKGQRHADMSIHSQTTLAKLLHGYVEGQMPDEIDELLYDLRLPVRTETAKVTRIAERQAELVQAQTMRTHAMKQLAATWEHAALCADLESGFTARYEMIPYMKPAMVLNLFKARYVPESGSILPSGEIAF
jgi:uncharacterized protein (DUF1778 family)